MPTFEGGQVLPVMASFSTQSSTPFSGFLFGVGSTFSTGDAAYIMANLYDALDKPDQGNLAISVPQVKLEAYPYKNARPKKDRKLLNFLEVGEVRPILFGTDTVLGLKVSWSGATASYPSSVTLGFRRKEATWAPITLANISAADSQYNFAVGIPSLLATLDMNVAIPGSAPHATLKSLQYFATGEAASRLARHYGVRRAMFIRADPANAAAFDVATDENANLMQIECRAMANMGQECPEEKWIKDNNKPYSLDSLLYDPKLAGERAEYMKIHPIEIVEFNSTKSPGTNNH